MKKQKRRKNVTEEELAMDVLDELDELDELGSPGEGEKTRTYNKRKRKNYRELYTECNERRNNRIDFSYYVNIESMIIELLLDNNLESFKNAGKLLFIVLSGMSPRVMYLKRVLNLVNFFFYKGGIKFYHSDMHLKILLFIFKRIKSSYMVPRQRIFNLLMSNNNLKELEKYKYVYTPKGTFFTFVDHLYYHIKDFMISVRKMLMQDWIEKVQAKALASNKSREHLLKKLKTSEKIVIYKETDEDVLTHFSKLFNMEYSKSLDKSLKQLIQQCIKVNFPLHSMYLDIYILYNIKNVVKLLVVIDQLFCSLFPYYYFYELKLKLLLLHIHRCQAGGAWQEGADPLAGPRADPINDATAIAAAEVRALKGEEDGSTFPNVAPSTKNAISAISLIRSLGGAKSEENSTLMYDESSVGNVNYQLGINDQKELRKLLKLRKKQKEEANECLNNLYSSDSSKSDNSNLSEHRMNHALPGDQPYNENNDDEKNLYLDAFMNLYINCTEGMVNSLPSLSELHDFHPLKQLNQNIRSKRMEGNLNNIVLPMLKESKINDINSVDMSMGMSVMEHEKDILGENELVNHFNIKQSEQLPGDDPVTTKMEEAKKGKLASLPIIENIHKDTYNDMAYNINVVASVAKCLIHSSNYDPIYIKLFYFYLLPLISFEKRVDVFLTYSYASCKIMKPLVFIIFYNNHTSTYILNTVKQIFKQDKFLFQKYKNSYFNGLSLRDIPKSHFIFLLLLSVFFYDHKAESLLYMFKLFCNYDQDVISDQERDINYMKIHEDVVLENDQKYTEQKKSINIIIIKFIEIYEEKFGTHLCDYFDFYRIFFILFASCVDME